jgi:hypothetical protein
MSDYHEVEERVLKAVEAYYSDKFRSLAAAARHFDAPYRRVKYRHSTGSLRTT